MRRSLLAAAAEREVPMPAQHLHGDPPMAGMLSTAEIDAITAARGAEFERLWLDGMILHHEGALDMANDEIDDGIDPETIALCESIVTSQTAEIIEMQALLAVR